MKLLAKAISKYVRISPRKIRLVAGMIRGKTVEEANLQLRFSQQRGGLLIQKTLDTAVSIAEMQHDMRRENLKIHEVRIDAGPVWKRAKSKNRGGKVPIMKRTSHITVIVAEKG